MKPLGAAYSVGEQLLSSGFTFFVFVAAARLMAEPELRIYSALFSLNQSFVFFLFGLVLLPIASSAGEGSQKQLGISLTLLVLLLLMFAIASPVAMSLLPSFDGRVSSEVWLLSVAFFSSQCIFETSRWLTIRLLGSVPAFSVSATRFSLFFLFLFLFLFGDGRLDAVNLALSHIGANLLAVVGFGLLLRHQVRGLRPALPDRSAERHIASFGNSVASFLTNFVVVMFVDRGFGGAGLAAFQAVRSAMNPVGLASQLIDNHFSAGLARSGRGLTSMARPITAAVAVSSAVLILTFAFAGQIVRQLFGTMFAEYALLVPLLLMASFAHALTRPVFVNWRIMGNTWALNLYSFVTIVIALPVLFILGRAELTYSMIAVFALLPIISLLLQCVIKANRQRGVTL